MRRPLVVGNWKMNGTGESSSALLRELDAAVMQSDSNEIGVCIPFLYIPDASRQLVDSNILLGSQNIADHDSGAFTGEISAAMLKEFNCQLAIVGHSERRLLYGESSELVAERYRQAVAGGITPILCVGETLEQRESGATFYIIVSQLTAVLNIAGVESLKQAADYR